jgi:hypothetical protein
MNNGLSRFIFYLQQITLLLDKAREQENPALWLFSNNARTPFFMLEGLSILYAEMHNSKKFGKLKAHFKLIEDGLGQIDYYNSLSVSFSSEKNIPAGYIQYVQKQSEQKVLQLNEVLADEGWLSDDNKRINKITEKLNEVDWLTPGEEIEAISVFYKKSITSITEFVVATNYHFDNVEKDVHELRRKLRWLSIYPQALQGAVQYAADVEPSVHLRKYLTDEIINSPYNKLPATGNNTSLLLLRKNYFLALSWVIAQLGNLKDEGLLLTGLCEALKQKTAGSEEKILAKAYTLLGRKQRKMQVILDNAEAITKTFIKENNLQHLIAGSATLTG